MAWRIRRATWAVAAFIAWPALAGCLGGMLEADLPGAPGEGFACRPGCGVHVPGPLGGAGEPVAAVDPRDPAHIVVGSTVIEALGPGTYRSWLAAHVSHDGGQTWEWRRLPGGPGAPGHPLAAYDAMADPVVEVLADGTVLFVGLAYRSAWVFADPVYALPFVDLSLFVARSEDGGLTYPEVEIVAQSRGGGWAFAGAGPVGQFAFVPGESHDKPWLAEGPDGTLLLTWTTGSYPPPGAPADVDHEDVRFSVSADGGRTWDAPGDVAVGHHLGSSATVAPDGTFYVPFLTWPDPPVSRLAVSADRGATWDVHRVPAPGAGRLVSVVATPTGPASHRVLVAYERQGAGGTVAPELAWSDDRGATWSAPLPLASPGVPGPAIPTLSADGEGRVYASYYLPLDADGTMEFRVVRLDGDAVAGPITLTDGPTRPGGWVGDYTGLAGGPRGAFAAWIDAVDGAPQVRGGWVD